MAVASASASEVQPQPNTEDFKVTLAAARASATTPAVGAATFRICDRCKKSLKETEWFLGKTQRSQGRCIWHCPVCGERCKVWSASAGAQLLVLDMPDGNTLVTTIEPLGPEQQDIFELLKFWSHKDYVRELLRPDVEEQAMYSALKNMIGLPHTESEKVMKAPKVTYRVVAPKLLDLDPDATIVEPDPAMQHALPKAAIGSQRCAYQIPEEVFSQPAWNNAQVDELLDCLLEMLDTDEAFRRHANEARAGKAAKLTDGQKRTMMELAGRQKRRRAAGRGSPGKQ